LETEGIIFRKVFNEAPHTHVEYSITKYGKIFGTSISSHGRI